MTTVPLRLLDQRRIAVDLAVAGRQTVLRGTGRYEEGALGGVLHIELPDAEGIPEIQIREREWDGQATIDTRYGCDYCIELVAPKT